MIQPHCRGDFPLQVLYNLHHKKVAVFWRGFGFLKTAVVNISRIVKSYTFLSDKLVPNLKFTFLQEKLDLNFKVQSQRIHEWW